MKLKKMTLTLRVDVALDESMLDIAGFRSLWEEIDELADTCREFGDLTHFEVSGFPPTLLLEGAAEVRQTEYRAELLASVPRGKPASPEFIDPLRE